MTVDEAVQNAARLLSNAELETDLARMERIEKLADLWLSLANLLAERERV
ncbi:hypothetical protein [Nonomuraea cavernae]|uniref:Uncharacterized protein n=1 Tax=Nonomuraea cavernae TaxID=2045107 RepID=A0A917YQ27_9ACTN|nr:hypothetical protein [Nonomuraea cavernae]MCA2184649.1 hypothetical protein [Nonomuraea cavernae]GGO63176.1 hypothetical protein GCM10012289_09500 [Nonomuraea cavernae]